MTNASSSTPVKTTGAERRRHPRIPILQNAVLKVTGRDEIACEIRDYCVGGLYLHLLAGTPSPLTLQIRIGEQVEICSVPDRASQPSHFAIYGRIVRLTHAGLGIAFDAQHAQSALNALDAVAKKPDRLSREAIDPNIERACQNELVELAKEAFRTFLERMEAGYLKAADQVKSGVEQTSFFDAIATLNGAKSLANEFAEKVKAQAVQYAIIAAPEPDQPSETLALVNAEAFEDWLNLMGEAARLEAAHDSSLRTLEGRIARLSGWPMDGKNDPYGPLALMNAFREVIRGQSLDLAAKKVAYGIFAGALKEVLGAYYARMEALTQSLAAPASDGMAGLRRAAINQAVANDPHSVRESLPDPDPDPAKAKPQQSIPGADSATRGETSDSLTASFQALQQLCGPGAVGSLGALTQPIGSVPVLPHVHAGSLAPPQTQALNLMGAVMGNILGSEVLHQDIKPILQQWQQPLFELAISDPNLLNTPEHPARRLLDSLDLVALSGSEASGIDPRVRQSLAAWTENLLKPSEVAPEVLTQIAQSLELLTGPLVKAKNRRIERLRETCEAQQRLADAHRMVEEQIDQRIAGRHVPEVVIQLLEQGWRQWLLLLRLRHDESHPEWRGSLGVLDYLLAWLADEAKRPEAGKARRLINFVDERLLPLCQDRAKTLALMDELANLLLGGGIPKKVRVEPKQATPNSAAAKLQSPAGFAVGDWLEYRTAPGKPGKPLQIAWIAPQETRFVFADRRGARQLELEAAELAALFEQGRIERSQDLDLPLSERTVTGLMQQMQTQLRDQLSRDAVTGLLNRKAFLRRLQNESARGLADPSHALCLLAVDQIKTVFNVCDVTGGESLLQELSQIIRGELQGDEFAAHVSDNQFALLFRHCTEEQAFMRGQRLMAVIKQYRFTWEDRCFQGEGQIGLAAFDPAMHQAGDAMKNADAACQRALEKGINQIHWYREDDQTLEVQHQVMNWAGRIDRVLGENRLFSRCQRIMSLSGTDDHSHYEVLLGIMSEQDAVLPPAGFIAAAERLKRVSDIDRWQVGAVFDWISQNRAGFDTLGGFAINLSGQSINSQDFLQFLNKRLDAARFPLEKIIFEITETAAIAEFAQAEKFMRQIRRYGCRFSLDDFGAGFSSYAYLKNLRADYLKIDGSFIKDLAHSETDYAMVKSMTEIGHSLGMKVVAEYVESQAIIDKLLEVGVDYAQGYHVGRPVRLEELLTPV